MYFESSLDRSCKVVEKESSLETLFSEARRNEVPTMVSVRLLDSLLKSRTPSESLLEKVL